MKSDRFKVLLVEDNPGDAGLLRQALAETPTTAFDLTHVERLGEAFSALAADRFDAVLLDLSLPDSQGFDTFSRLRLRANGVPVVVLSGADDETLAIKAVQKGAQDYLVKGQVGNSSLLRSLRHAIERDKRLAQERDGQRKQGKVISVVGVKGGVGATTVAVNVAAALAAQKKQVIAVELRGTPGTLALQMNRRPFEDLSSLQALAPAALTAAQMANTLTDSPHGFRILFGPQHYGAMPELSAGQAEAIVARLAGLADYVILDLPGPGTAAVQAAIRRSSFVTLVSECEPASASLGGLAVELFASWGVSRERVGAVVVHRGAVPSHANLADIRERLRCQVVGLVLPAADACALSEKLGVPLVLSQPQELAAVALTRLAEQLAAGELNPVVLN